MAKDTDELAKQAAEKAVEILKAATTQNGSATWVLAGGTAPMKAYEIIATDYVKSLDWSRVWFILGDERIVPLNDPLSNWHQIERTLLSKLPVETNNLLRPKYELSTKLAAQDYEQVLKTLPIKTNGVPRLDLLWLGIGEDGHTLSLFPGKDTLAENTKLIVEEYDSPKPPGERISLSLAALRGASKCFVLTSGEGKAEVLRRVMKDNEALPIKLATETVENSGGQVTWLIDKTAAAKL